MVCKKVADWVAISIFIIPEIVFSVLVLEHPPFAMSLCWMT